MRRINRKFNRYKEFGPLFIRCLVGFHLIKSVFPILFTPGSMQGVVTYFDSQNIIMPSVLAPVVAYAEFICGVLFIVGALVRPAAIAMVIVFICALLIVHIGDSYTNSFPALVILAGSLSLLFTGAGRISVDHQWRDKNLMKETFY